MSAVLASDIESQAISKESVNKYEQVRQQVLTRAAGIGVSNSNIWLESNDIAELTAGIAMLPISSKADHRYVEIQRTALSEKVINLFDTDILPDDRVYVGEENQELTPVFVLRTEGDYSAIRFASRPNRVMNRIRWIKSPNIKERLLIVDDYALAFDIGPIKPFKEEDFESFTTESVDSDNFTTLSFESSAVRGVKFLNIKDARNTEASLKKNAKANGEVGWENISVDLFEFNLKQLSGEEYLKQINETPTQEVEEKSSDVLDRIKLSFADRFSAVIGSIWEKALVLSADLKGKITADTKRIDQLIVGTIGKLIEVIPSIAKSPVLKWTFEGNGGAAKLYLLDKWAEGELGAVTDLVVDVAKVFGVDNIRFGTWSGPQGTGKDTNITAISNAAKEFKEEIASIEDNVPDELIKLVDTFTGNVGKVKTGKSGIFLQPLGEYKELFGKMPELIKELTDNGLYVGDAFTSVFTYLMIARNIIQGNTSIQLDLYPRTQAQTEHLNLLSSRLKKNGVDVSEDKLDLEMYSAEEIKFVEANRDEFTRALKGAAGKMSGAVKNALVEIKAALKSDTEVTVMSLSQELGYSFKKQLPYYERLVEEISSSGTVSDRIVAGGLTKAIERVKARREKAGNDSELRDDDFPLALLGRLSSSAKASADLIKEGVDIISTDNTPGNVIESIVKSLLKGANLKNPYVKRFIEIARENAELEVGGKNLSETGTDGQSKFKVSVVKDIEEVVAPDGNGNGKEKLSSPRKVSSKKPVKK